jgi:hypothetical protein
MSKLLLGFMAGIIVTTIGFSVYAFSRSPEINQARRLEMTACKKLIDDVGREYEGQAIALQRLGCEKYSEAEWRRYVGS